MDLINLLIALFNNKLIGLIRKADQVVVHGGAAHRDDFLFVGLVRLINPTIKISRRDPTPAELKNPRIICGDVGGRFCPEKGNFDHHQFERGDTRCALYLLVQALSPQWAEDAMTSQWGGCGWLANVSLVDTLGPRAKDQGAMFPDLISTLVISRWQDGDDSMTDLAIAVMELKVHQFASDQKARERTDELDLHVTPSGVQVIIIPRNEELDLIPVLRKTAPGAVYVLDDNRNPDGVAVMRGPDLQDQVDLSPCDKFTECGFAHAGGFIAKFNCPSRERVVELLDEVL